MDDIENLLTRGVDKIYPSREALEKVLRSGKKLRVFQGFDPTGIQLHIGHAVGFRKLAQFQRLGHEVIFLIGDGTGQAGDPSGKKRSREQYLTSQQLRENGKTYVMQSRKIMDFEGINPVKIVYNGDWLNKLPLSELLDIAGHFTLQQMLERDLYQDRLKNQVDVNLREFLYPLLQGYDSVAMEVDLEIGGSDQTFNMLAGRKLVEQIQHREKFVVTVPLLTDSKGTKIGKTEGNVIGLTDPANDFYGKIMSLGDDAIIPCFTLLTDKPLEEINNYQLRITNGENPMIFKKQLAFELTKRLNDEKSAELAQKEFEHKFQEKSFDSIETKSLSLESMKGKSLSDAISALGLTKSKSEAKRLLEQHAIRLDDVILSEDNTNKLTMGSILKIGKTKFFKLI